MKLDSKHVLGYTFLLLAQLMVGISIVSAKSLLENIPAITLLAIRFTLAFLFLMGFHFVSSKETIAPLKNLSRRDWFFIIAQALCAGAFFNIFLLLGLHYTSASVAGIIMSALPAIIVIFSILFLKESITFSTMLCIGFAVLGLVVINASHLSGQASQNLLGDLLILISLIPEAAYYVLSKYHGNKLPIFLVSALMNGINIPVFLLILLFQHSSISLQMLWSHLLLLFVIGASSALFYVFWISGSKHIHGSSAGLTTAFMPIGTLFIAWVFLSEKISILQLVGMLFVILSIVMNAAKQFILSKKYHLSP